MTAVTVAAEVRVTPWIDLTQRPEWADSNVAAYRIWQRVSAFGWEQRHEWRSRGGGEWSEAWIRGVTTWCDGAEPVAADEAEAA